MTFLEISEYLHEINIVSVFCRLSLATFFGAMVGMDRAKKLRPAGFRTHMLVCMGAAMVMITNQFLVQQGGGGDPARLGAQVISGIGFLGAGTIIVTRRNQVVGLTTAAGLWSSACMGLAIGAGFYSGALLGTLFVFFIVVVFHGMDERFQKKSKNLQIYAEFDSPAQLSSLLSYTAQNGMQIGEVELVQARNEAEHIGAIIQIRLPERADHMMVVSQLQKIEGVVFLAKL